MSAFRRLFPHPLWSAVLAVLWLWLNESISLGHLALAALLGIWLPMATHRFLPESVPHPQPRKLVRFVARVAWDIVVANLVVARRILGPSAKLHPEFVEVELELEDVHAITLLASTVSLTPGTVSAELSPDRRSLLVHALTLEPGEDLAGAIKERYEKPIQEMFA